MQYHATTKSANSNKGARRRIRLLGILITSVLIWACLTIWDQAGQMNKESAELEALLLKHSEILKVNENTKREIVRLNDSEYKEEKARSELHYARPGETVFSVPK